MNLRISPELAALYPGTPPSKFPEYNVWAAMRQRCGNPKHPAYSDYGARKIRVCKRWREFGQFLADVGRRPGPEYSLERIDNDAGYSPENCRWARRSEQSRNKRNNVWITFNGKTQCLSDWAKETGLNPSVLRRRLARWDVEKALTTPSQWTALKRPMSQIDVERQTLNDGNIVYCARWLLSGADAVTEIDRVGLGDTVVAAIGDLVLKSSTQFNVVLADSTNPEELD